MLVSYQYFQGFRKNTLNNKLCFDYFNRFNFHCATVTNFFANWNEKQYSNEQISLFISSLNLTFAKGILEKFLINLLSVDFKKKLR